MITGYTLTSLPNCSDNQDHFTPWADLPGRYGPHTTCYNRFRRWTKAGIWDMIMDEVTKTYDGTIQMIDGSVVRVHHSAATLKKATRIDVWVDRAAD